MVENKLIARKSKPYFHEILINLNRYKCNKPPTFSENANRFELVKSEKLKNSKILEDIFSSIAMYVEGRKELILLRESLLRKGKIRILKL